MNTKKILTLTAIALATAGLSACQNDTADETSPAAVTSDAVTDPTMGTDTADAGMDTGMDGTGMDPAADPAAAASQGESLALVMAVDQHEIAAAEQARTKNPPADVLEYANMLHTEHSRNLEADRQVAQDTGIEPATTDAVTAQKQKGQAELDRLAELDGEAYADAYVDAMVKGHTEALAMIDDRLADAATEPALRTHLTNTREHIAKHLEQGKALQGDE